MITTVLSATIREEPVHLALRSGLDGFVVTARDRHVGSEQGHTMHFPLS